ncbi:MAG: hypothetical protein PHV99_03485 [Candidatus Pacebacteria bacterium]|nr:hypothetical protein [Candidatus Paceibacterota bacterium]
MPQNRLSSNPPRVSSRWEATPILAAFIVLDLLRAFFQFFWFFGPALAASACITAVNNAVGVTAADIAGKLVAAGCAAAGIAGGTAASAFTTPFGLLMADAIGFVSFLSFKLWTLMNSRVRNVQKTMMLWQMGGFLLSEVPFIGALPVYSPLVWFLYGRVIQTEKKELKKWEAATAAARQKQEAQRMQVQAAQQQQALQEETQRAEEEAALEATASETLPASVPEFGSASVKTSPSPQLATMPDYSRSAANEPARNVFTLFSSGGAKEMQKEVPKEERKAA